MQPIAFQSIAQILFFGAVAAAVLCRCSGSFVMFQVFRCNSRINSVECVCANCYIKKGLRRQTSSGVCYYYYYSFFFQSINILYMRMWAVHVLLLLLGIKRAKEIIGVGFLISVWTYALQCWLHWSPVDLIEARFARFCITLPPFTPSQSFNSVGSVNSLLSLIRFQTPRLCFGIKQYLNL